MTRYTAEFKAQIVRKMMPPNSQSVAQISRDTGIAAPTLYAWRQSYRTKGYLVPANSKTPDGWGWKDKVAAVLKTQSMNQAEIAQYCREQGLYPEQIAAWQAVFEQAEQPPISKEEAKANQKRVKQLEKELRRKDKALAEAAALLVLSKKAQALWGDNKED